MRKTLCVFIGWLCAVTMTGQTIDLSEPSIYPSNYYASCLAIGDMNNDGNPDIIIGNQPLFSKDAKILVKDFVSGNEPSLQQAIPYPYTGYGISALHAVDLNLDLFTDIIIATDTIVGIYYQRTGGMDSIKTYPQTHRVNSIAIADLDGNGFADLALGYINTPSIGLLFQDSTETFRYEERICPEGGYRSLQTGDLNGDTKQDLAMASSSGSDTVRLYAFIQQSYGLDTLYRTYQSKDFQDEGLDLSSLAIADVTGDGKDDIVVSAGTDTLSASIFVWRQKPNGTFFKNPIQIPTYHNPQVIQVTDLNGDGFSELVACHAGWKALTVFGNGGNPQQISQQRIPVPYVSSYHAQDLALEDINGDSVPDIILVHHNNKLLIIENEEVIPQALQIDSSLLKDILDPIDEENPVNISGLVAYPNPTDLSTTVRFHLSESSLVELSLFDLNGKNYYQAKFSLSGGMQAIQIDLSSVPAGTYLLHANDESHGDRLLHKLTIFNK